jgi:hypothetical protein
MIVQRISLVQVLLWQQQRRQQRHSVSVLQYMQSWLCACSSLTRLHSCSARIQAVVCLARAAFQPSPRGHNIPVSCLYAGQLKLVLQTRSLHQGGCGLHPVW